MFTSRRLASLLFTVIAIGSVACSYRDSRPMTGPDGRQWLAVTCTHGADNCWQEAADRCPRGYVTAEQDHSTTPGTFGNGGTLVTVTQQRGEMLIQCREPPVAPPAPATAAR
jgi:hypothetical protein